MIFIFRILKLRDYQGNMLKSMMYIHDTLEGLLSNPMKPRSSFPKSEHLICRSLVGSFSPRYRALLGESYTIELARAKANGELFLYSIKDGGRMRGQSEVD